MTKEKATLDQGALDQEPSRSLQKVELDLDDAIFLDDDDDDIEEEQPAADPASKKEGEAKATPHRSLPLWKNKKVLFGGIILLVITIALAVAWILFQSEPTEPPPVAPPKKEEPSQPKPPKAPPKLVEYTVLLDPFWVEHLIDGEYRFLSCQFSLPVKGDLLKWEVTNKRIILRDAIYYYLKHKDILFLSDPKNVSKLKSDLLSIVNQYLGNGQIEEILIQEYKVQ